MAKADSNFSLDEFIDSGLYGVVWKATQFAPARTVAVKIVNPEHGMTFNAAEHAQGLVRAGPHPNIVDVYQVTYVEHPETKEVVEAVVMEWLQGISLGQRLAESPLLSPTEGLDTCNGLLNGIAHLHANGVTHSDLHVGNVILTSQGPRIIDIDYSSAQSLARLTTLERDYKIIADVTQVAGIIGMLIRKTAIAQQFHDTNEQQLRTAVTLDGVQAYLVDAFEQPEALQRGQSESETVLLKSTASQDTHVNIISEVEAAIESGRKVQLRHLVMDTANSIVRELTGDIFPSRGQVEKEQLRERVADYKATIQPLLPALATLGFWGGPLEDSLAIEAIDRIANAHEKHPMEGGTVAFLNLRQYPVVSAFYTTGIGAVAGGNYQGLMRILRETVFYEHGQTKQNLWTELAYGMAEQRDSWNNILGRDMYFPVSQVLEDDLREAHAQTIPSDLRYIESFDRFEFFASLDHFLFSGRALGVSFLWRRQKRSREDDLLAEIHREAELHGDNWAPLKAGLLNGTKKTNILEVLDEFRISVQEVMNAYRMW